MRRLLALSLLLLSGCGSVLTMIDDPPPKPGMSQVVFRRIGNVVPFAGGANIEINGEQVANLGTHERYIQDIKPGRTVVSVFGSMFSSGHHTIAFDAKADTVYRLNIAPSADTILYGLPSDYKVTESAGFYRFGRGN
jgi:hypothetical protein